MERRQTHASIGSQFLILKHSLKQRKNHLKTAMLKFSTLQPYLDFFSKINQLFDWNETSSIYNVAKSILLSNLNFKGILFEDSHVRNDHFATLLRHKFRYKILEEAQKCHQLKENVNTLDEIKSSGGFCTQELCQSVCLTQEHFPASIIKPHSPDIDNNTCKIAQTILSNKPYIS